jgi:hypothetical protein
VSTLKSPTTPAELLEQLFAIFPQYRTNFAGPIHDGEPTYHSVLLAFTSFFGAQVASFSEAQLRSFGELVNRAVEQDDLLENAFGTCLLEHLHQIKAWHALKPHLSKIAREKSRA